MKVCRFCPGYYEKSNPRDLNSHMYYLMDGLSKFGVKNTVVTPNSNKSEINGIKVYKVPQRKRFTTFMLGVDAYRDKLKDIVQDFDLFHTHQVNFFSIYHYKGKIRKKFVHTMHGSPFAYKYTPIKSFSALKDYSYFYFLNKYEWRRADLVITTNNQDRDELISKEGLSSEKVITVPTGVDTKLFKEKKVKKDIDLLYVGRLAVKKNLPTILKVFEKLLKTNNNLKLWIVGFKEVDYYYPFVRDFIRERSLSNSIFLVKEVPQEKLPEIYSRTKVFILPSFEEGLPKVMLEAMACGVPVVTTNRFGMKDVIEDGKDGFLVDIPVDVDGFYNKVNLLLKDDKLRNNFSKRGKLKVKKCFNWGRIAKQVYLGYKGVM